MPSIKGMCYYNAEDPQKHEINQIFLLMVKMKKAFEKRRKKELEEEIKSWTKIF